MMKPEVLVAVTGGRRRWPLATRSALLACVALMLAFVSAGSARATLVDNSSSAKATRAYATFLHRLVSQAPAWQTKGDAFIASVTASCPNVLAAVNMLPLTATNAGGIRAFGGEMGSDLAAASNAANQASFERLARALTRLHWSSRGTRSAITRFIAAGRVFLRLPPSDLCTDARALAASSAQTTPPGTVTWLATYTRIINAQHRGLDGFIRVLERFRTPADRRFVNGINNLAVVLTADQNSFLSAEVPKLGAALGLTG
jgi:hypothetical protein